MLEVGQHSPLRKGDEGDEDGRQSGQEAEDSHGRRRCRTRRRFSGRELSSDRSEPVDDLAPTALRRRRLRQLKRSIGAQCDTGTQEKPGPWKALPNPTKKNMAARRD